GKGAGDHVRIGLAIDAPDATAFFDSARVLMIGETNHLTAQFSSDAIAQRSRLRIAPEMPVTQDPAKEPLKIVYHIGVPETAVHGDHADLSIETDGAQMSHARPQLLRPVTLRLTDAIGVRMGPNSILTLAPAVVPVNQRAGRDVTVAIRNNAPEIRNFKLELRAEGLDFSPVKMDVSVGASATREVSFRVFAKDAAPGLHVGQAKISGAASAEEAVRFVVIPPNGAAAFTADGFDFLESAKIRASFFTGRWLEWLNKDNGQDALPAGGVPFGSGLVEARGDELKFGEKTYRLQDLEPLLPKPKR
ncbi:MAG TPA: hypothetical protein VHB50_19220, partial [Bryobacteraceae bacterium]|nr:hypothetical protein [Bryobacteraceae bacterium]